MKYDPFFHVVLVEPEIPNNTGNIGRTCVGMQSKLHLVEPLAFEINDKQLRRSGLDYWPHLEWQSHKSLKDWQAQNPNPQRTFYFSTKAKKSIYEIHFQKGDTLVFGKETKGLPEDLVFSHLEQAVKIPMLGPIRSYNLANSVAVALFEASRQVQINKG
jgi:tRNA (cytidine/uridine-2'-O-)-methyltransferase